MRRLKRAPAGFNLAFLDIMACGLGAIILIFMLVKYNVDTPTNTTDTTAELTVLENELADIQTEVSDIETENTALQKQLQSLKEKLQQQIKRTVTSDSAAQTAAQELIALTKEIAALESKLNTPTPKPVTPATDDDHLIGLRVTGARVLIVVDSSASMADDLLVDIIKIEASTDIPKKKAAPKWQRTLAVTEWILDRVDAQSEYMVLHYSDRANFLPAAKWLRGGDGAARVTVDDALEKIYPDGATNLDAALVKINTVKRAPTDIYLITDGLPTKGSLSTVKKLKHCRGRNKKIVSGKCRAALFEDAITSFSRKVVVNTVLLPVEGDPWAAGLYWAWAIGTGGTMISPAANWP